MSIEPLMESELTLEQRAVLLEGCRELAEIIAETWPQANQSDEGDPFVNYYFCGSIEPIMLAQAEEMQILDSNHLPASVPKKSIRLSDTARECFGRFARRISDVDFVPLGHYSRSYSFLRKEIRLDDMSWIDLEKLPYLAKRAVVVPEHVFGSYELVFHEVKPYGGHEIARIGIGGNPYWIQEPKTVFAHKMIWMVNYFSSQTGKYNRDVPLLHDALLQLYTEDELANSVSDILRRCYEERGDDLNIAMDGLLSNRNLDEEIRKFFEKVIELYVRKDFQKNFITAN